MILVGVPLDPDAQEARRLLLEELADPRYRAAEPTWFDRTVQAIRDWFASLSVPTDGAGVPLAAVIGVVVLLALVVAALLIAGAPRRRRRSALSRGAVLAADDGRSADSIRALAEAAAARGDFDEALVERFRALVRALDERTVVSHSPGTTAHGFARRASAAFPGSAEALRRCADDFDRVRYLDGHGTAADYERIRDLDRSLAATTPDLGPALDPLAALAPRR